MDAFVYEAHHSAVTKEQEAELRAIQERLAKYRAMTHVEWELANVDAYWSLCSREANYCNV